MTQRIIQLALAIGLAAGLAAAAGQNGVATAHQSVAGGTYSTAADQTPLSADAARELLKRSIANQHRDDEAVDSFECVEERVVHNGGPSGPVSASQTYRVVPTGSGTLRLLVKAGGQKVAPEQYRRELNDWKRILNVAVNPNDPQQIASVAKQKKKLKSRERLVDAVFKAYRVEWEEREIHDGRIVEVLRLEPNPDYTPQGDATDWLTHARATVWIDEQAAQLERVDAKVIRDISIGAGILGKVYHGSRFILEQTEAAPGIWEPSYYEYDVTGRKFLFPFSMYESTQASHYRFIGPPTEALAIVTKDIASGGAFEGDP